MRGDINKLIKGISFSWIRFVISIGIGILQTPLIFKHLPKDEISSWYVFFSFGTFLQMADLGLSQTISRMISYVDAKGNSEYNGEQYRDYKHTEIYVTSLLSFFLLLTLFGAGIIIAYSLLKNNVSHNEDIIKSFSIYMLGMIFTLLSNIPAAMLNGYRDVTPESVIKITFQILFFISIYIGLPHFNSILFIAVAFLVQNFSVFLTTHIALSRRQESKIIYAVPFYRNFNVNVSKTIYRQSAPLAINQLGGWLSNQGSVFVASLVIASTQIADYAITQQIFAYIMSIMLVINQAVGPFIARQFVKGEMDIIRLFFINTTVLSLLLVGSLLLLQIICGYEIISIWVGAEHYLGFLLFFILSITTYLEVNHSIAGNFVWNTNSWPFNRITLITGFTNLILGFGLGKLYGYLGIAFAALLSKLIVLNWYVIFVCIKKLSIKTIDYLKETLIPVTIILLFAGMVLYFTKNYIVLCRFNNLIIIVVTAISCFVIIFSLSFYLFGRTIIKDYKTLQKQ